MADGKPVRSPDHWSVQSPGAPGMSYTNVNLRRSRDFGVCILEGRKILYGLLEGPLWDAEGLGKGSTARKPRGSSNSTSPLEKFTGRYWQYVFEQNGNAIGDFNMIDATSGLIIRRDNGEGTADKACPQGTAPRIAFRISPNSSASTRSDFPTPTSASRPARSPIST